MRIVLATEMVFAFARPFRSLTHTMSDMFSIDENTVKTLKERADAIARQNV